MSEMVNSEDGLKVASVLGKGSLKFVLFDREVWGLSLSSWGENLVKLNDNVAIMKTGRY